MKMEFSPKHCQFKHPFTAIVAGPTGSGKTVLVRQILSEHETTIANTQDISVLWLYGQWQSLYQKSVDNVKIKYVEGLPDVTDIKQGNHTIVVIDDLMSELSGNKALTNLFTKGSHHLNLSVIFIVQNMFHHGKEMRTISLNTNYYLLLKNPRDRLQIEHLARQMFPGTKSFIRDAYKDATNKPYGYLIIDCKSDTPEELRVRTRILCTEHLKGLFRPFIYTSK